ncbi:MAG: histidine kinase dimerization/phospho-acceptor domain-containing protein, partial [Ginsengibacter sp.]
MKLLSKYNRVNVPVMIGSLVVSSIAFYFILHFVLLNQLDKDLVIEEQEINEYVAHNQLLPRTSSYPDQVIAFYQVKAAPHRSFSSAKIYNKGKQEKELYRQLVFQVVVQDKLYAATVRKSQQESEDLLKLIVSITLAVILLLFLGIFTVNRFILRQLWRPFHTVMEQLKKFDISGKSELQFSTSDIDEFNELNKTAKLLTNKVTSDYDALKSFTENASHEIQTPLAIIQMKLELLTQSENLTRGQVDIVVAIHEAADRLSRLNQSLLLLTKLDNSQFAESENVDISLLLEKH